MTVIRHITAPRERVWEVLADGWTYSQWVVGNSRIRAVDEDWPAPGSTIHHTIGLWPLAINDETVVERCTPQEELVLLATLTPFTAARISLRLAEIPDGCRVEMQRGAGHLATAADSRPRGAGGRLAAEPRVPVTVGGADRAPLARGSAAALDPFSTPGRDAEMAGEYWRYAESDDKRWRSRRAARKKRQVRLPISADRRANRGTG